MLVGIVKGKLYALDSVLDFDKQLVEQNEHDK